MARRAAHSGFRARRQTKLREHGKNVTLTSIRCGNVKASHVAKRVCCGTVVFPSGLVPGADARSSWNFCWS
jgi:hypothetical protein